MAVQKEKYLRYAERCVRAAETATSAEERLHFLEMAQSWRSLAERADVVDALVEQAKEQGLIPPKAEMH